MLSKLKFRKPVVVLLLVMFFVVSVVDGGSKRRRGTAGAQELMIPVGARNIAMSGSFMAGLSGIEAAAWNPAGVAGMEGNGEAMFSNTAWLAGINVYYAGVASNLGGKNFYGVTLRNVDFGDIMVTTTEMPDGTGEVYSPSYLTLGFLYSRRMTDRILFGADIKLIHEGIMRETASGFVMDAGVQYITGPGGIRIGAALKNLGLNMWFNGPDLEELHRPAGSEPGTSSEPRRVHTQEFEMPTSLEMGLAYGPIDLGGVSSLNVAASFLNNNFSFDEYRFGGEFAVMRTLFIRGGYTFGFDPEPFGPDFIEESGDEGDDAQWESQAEEFIWGPTFGFGLNTSQLTGLNLTIDYAYRTAEFFDGIQWVTLSLGF